MRSPGNRRQPLRTKETPAPSILIVEDEAPTRSAMAELLAETGYQVRAAADGAEALTMALAERPDLVISDIRMPRVDGLELAQRLRARYRDDYLPIILISADGEPGRRANGLDHGADDYMAKPIEFEELLARIRVQLRHASRQRDLVRRAVSDELTGVLNRRGILAVLEDQLARVGEDLDTLSVVLIDVNDFKLINDQYGHAVGDLVLNRVARALLSQVRGDDLVGRLGGDEFLVVVPGHDAVGAAGLVRRLGDLRDLPSLHALGLEHAVTVAAGAATATAGETAAHLIERADLAMYHDKGRNLRHR
jgi:diguanylate cyclase (GGDEF)-like protein